MKKQENSAEKLTECQKAIIEALESKGQATRQEIQEELKSFAHSTIDANLRELKNKDLIEVDQVSQPRQRFEQVHSVPVNAYKAKG